MSDLAKFRGRLRKEAQPINERNRVPGDRYYKEPRPVILLCPECDKPLTANRAEDHVYPWFCKHCDVVYDWQDLEHAAVAKGALRDGR